MCCGFVGSMAIAVGRLRAACDLLPRSFRDEGACTVAVDDEPAASGEDIPSGTDLTVTTCRGAAPWLWRRQARWLSCSRWPQPATPFDARLRSLVSTCLCGSVEEALAGPRPPESTD